MSPQRPKRGLVSRYWLVILWALLIFSISSIPHLSNPTPSFKILDKIFHCIEFGVFGYLLVTAIAWKERSAWRRKAAVAILIGVLLGFFDEMYQSLIPGRAADPYDIAADVLGVFIAVGLWIVLLRRRSLEA